MARPGILHHAGKGGEKNARYKKAIEASAQPAASAHPIPFFAMSDPEANTDARSPATSATKYRPTIQ